jgi:hypothetical protein
LTDFCKKGYLSLILSLKGLNYDFVTFNDFSSQYKQIILRHDVDFRLDDALEMALAESKLNISSTYFFLLGSEFYNLFSKAGKSTLLSIIDLGHEIGLHFDASIYKESDVQSKILYERRILQDQAETPVKTFSFHRGALSRLGTENGYFGMDGAYDKKFFRDIGYCSDSEGRWRHHHPLKHPCIQGKKSFQLLIHPIWWSPEMPTSPSQRLISLHHERSATGLAHIRANTKVV